MQPENEPASEPDNEPDGEPDNVLENGPDASGTLEIPVAEAARIHASDSETRFIDVRETWERETAVIARTEQLTEALVDELLAAPDRDAEIIVVCHHGIRSLQAAAFFAERGFTNVRSMTGGIQAWSEQIDNSIPTY